MTGNPSARLSIVVYRAKPGKDAELWALAKEHVPFLRELGLASDRPPILATSASGALIEIFEWAEGGLEKAHAHPALGELWGRYAQVCDFVPLNTLAETSEMFTNFTPAD